MKIEFDHVEKPLQKLRKMLGDFSADPRPADVHALRTHARRLEAAIAALVPARSKESRRVLKLLTPVRKAAGKVRDMDVLIEDALALGNVQRAEGLVRLVEHLGQMRAKNAKRLTDMVANRRKTSAHLKELSKVFRKQLKDEPGTLNGGAAPQILVTELIQWPQLNRENLHLFRLRIKELRYMLELSNEPNEQWVAWLGDVKDAIGEWHDWVGLLKIAKQVLDPGRTRSAKRIASKGSLGCVDSVKPDAHANFPPKNGKGGIKAQEAAGLIRSGKLRKIRQHRTLAWRRKTLASESPSASESEHAMELFPVCVPAQRAFPQKKSAPHAILKSICQGNNLVSRRSDQCHRITVALAGMMQTRSGPGWKPQHLRAADPTVDPIVADRPDINDGRPRFEPLE